jgi:transketolase
MKTSNIQMRDAFLSELYSKAKSNRNILLISNDQGAKSLDKFREDIPTQFINAGVSEQNIISVSAGLNLGGKTVYIYSIASFITLRCFEQIKLDLCCMNLPVTILGVGSCYSYSLDGPTHHATEDIALMRALPNMQIFSPSDSNMAAGLVNISLHSTSPMYIRLDREVLPKIYNKNEDFSSGFSVLDKGKDISIISTGIMVHKAMEISKELNKNSINAQVIDLYRLKPLNKRALINTISSTGKVVTLEEHTIHGGLGSIIAELLVDFNTQIPIKRLGIEDGSLYGYGTRNNLHRQGGIDKKNVLNLIKNLFQ